MKYTEFTKQCENRVTEIFNKNGVFWAFSKNQFEENKTPIAAGEKYIAIGGGGYMPSSKFEQLDKDFDSLHDWKLELFQQVDTNEAILYELSNHEYCITYDITDTFNVLSSLGVTREQVRAIANANY